MKHFDLYCAVESDPLLVEPLSPGKKVWLDGIDGFFDQYFGRCCPDQIRFVVLAIKRSSGQFIPNTRDGFEALPFIEARVVNREEVRGEVEITSVLTFGNWLTQLQLENDVRLSDLPESLKPWHSTLVRLLEQASRTGWAIWKSSQEYWKNLDETSAIYVFETESEIRCAVLKTNAVPSFLFRVNKDKRQ